MDIVQAEVFAFLQTPQAWPGGQTHIETIDTHGARVFLAGETVLKIKRAVRLPYLDFSTLASRKYFCDREIALNKIGEGGIYRDVVAITRESDGSLAVAGSGTPVEWAVRMHRFGQDDLLLNVVQRGAFTRALAEDLADTIYRYHAAAPVAQFSALDRSAVENIERVAANVQRSLAPHLSNVSDLSESLSCGLSGLGYHLRVRRASAGFVRRCHGDLHLGNIVLWKGKPVPFDALEFDEDLATIDTLYDLAFLLMDLDRHSARDMANAMLNRYLWRSHDLIDVEGLALLPGFLGLRAAIRAMVTLDRIANEPARADDLKAEAMKLIDDACLYFHGANRGTLPAPRLVAIGGLSGTGKTTLARALAPSIGTAPGALHLRTDMERKALADVEPTDRLPPEAYTKETSDAAYARVFERARVAMTTTQHSVVIDAVFADPAERQAAEDIAKQAGRSFIGLWLEGGHETLSARIEARRNDASDATPAVLARQLTYDLGPISWHRLDASGSFETTLEAAWGVLDSILKAEVEAAGGFWRTPSR